MLIKNVDRVIGAVEEGEITWMIGEDFQVKRVVKILNSQHLLKIIFQNSHDADRAVERGMQIHFQKFQDSNIERELFVPVVPCFRCFAYGHFKSCCPKPADYKVCSTCASEGLIYKECPNKSVPTCINYSDNHRTLAAKCSIRKDIVGQKLKKLELGVAVYQGKREGQYLYRK